MLIIITVIDKLQCFNGTIHGGEGGQVKDDIEVYTFRSLIQTLSSYHGMILINICKMDGRIV